VHVLNFLISNFIVCCEGIEDLPIVVEYNNLHLTDSLKAAKDALYNGSGVYAIKCLETGALYIGSSTKYGGND